MRARMSAYSCRSATCLIGIGVTIGVGMTLTMANVTRLGALEQEKPGDPVGDPAERLLEERRSAVLEAEESVKHSRDELSQSLTDIAAGKRAEVERARSAHQDARRALEDARIELVAYEEGTYPAERKTAHEAIALYESGLATERGFLEQVKQRFEEQEAPEKDYIIAQYRVRRSELQVEQARQQLELLEKFTHDKTVASLKGAIEKAKGDELAANLDYEEAREEAAKAESNSLRFRSASPQEHVLKLLDEAIASQERFLAVVVEIHALLGQEAAEGRDAAIKAKRGEADQLQALAGQRFKDAIVVSALLTGRWKELLDAEKRLKDARESLAIAEGIFAPK